MKQIIWSKPAQADLADIDSHYRMPEPDHADHAIERAFAAAAFLCRNPEAGLAIQETQVRRWRAAATPYVLLYRVAPQAIRVSRVIHVKRDWQCFVR